MRGKIRSFTLLSTLKIKRQNKYPNNKVGNVYERAIWKRKKYK